MIRTLLGWFRRLPNSIQAGARTALISFAVTFLGTLTKWLTDVMEWIDNTGGEFPDPALLGRALATGVLAVAIGVGNVVVVWVQERYGLGNPPVYPSRPASSTRRSIRGG